MPVDLAGALNKGSSFSLYFANTLSLYLQIDLRHGYWQVEPTAVVLRKSDCEFEFVIDNLFDRNSSEAGVGEQDGERRFVFVEFVLGNSCVVNQSLSTKLSDQLSLRHP